MKWVKLGDIIRITSGGTPLTSKREYYDNGTIRWVKTGDLKKQYLFETPDRITQLGLENSSAKIFPINTVLIAMYGATIGNCSILKIAASTNQACAALLPTKNINEEYLYFYLRTIKQQLIDQGVGGGQPNISATILKQTNFPLIPLGDQIQIANILSKAEALIGQRKESLRLLDEFLRSTFLEMFGDPVRNEKEWQKIMISDVVMRLDAGKSIQSVEKEAAGKYKVLKTSSVSWGRFNKEEAKWLPLGYLPPKDHLIQKGDILMSRMNTTELVGASTYVFDDVKNLALPDRIWKFILSKENSVNPLFLWYCINWSSFRRVISEMSSGTSGSMKNITKGSILNLPLIYPDKYLQTQFAHIVEKTEALKAYYQTSLQELENLYGSLSQRAFKGKLNLK